ncbi:MAG TPA: hypothetical protein VNK26_01890, partial [Pyrinomonadaceae bacterium]|nr:hypothetical protein [Pyrinomonadaceae bacterium]
IMREIKDLSENGPQPSEMQKLHNQLLNDTVRMRQSSMARAQEIAEFELYDGDGNLANRELDDLLAISPEDIRNAAAKFLDTENRALLDVEPGS